MSSVAHVPSPRATQGLISIATYLAVPLAVGAVIWLHELHFFSDTPVWVLLLILLGTAPCNVAAAAWLRRNPTSTVRLHVRAASTACTTAAVIYGVGWGALLVVAYAVGAAELLRTGGVATARPHMWWCLGAMTVGEVGVEAGWWPSVMGSGLSHAVAITGVVCLAIVVRVLAQSAQATELAEQLLRDRGAHFEALIEHAADVIGVIDRSGRIQSMSPAVVDLLGYLPHQLVGRDIRDFLRTDQVDELAELVAQAEPGSGEIAHLELELTPRDGQPRLVATTLSAPPADWGENIIVNLHDVTRQRALERQLRHDASHDSLTGLLNRKAFGEACETACARAARSGWSVGMLYIDLDGFKAINDSFGHDLGDRVLVETARRLDACIRRDEMVARLGGDEFAVLIEAVRTQDQAIVLAERILDALARPLSWLPDGVRLGASIGIAVRSSDGIEMSNLMRLADEAMYHAKRNGRFRWELSGELRDSVTIP